ncbi:MAG: flavodoxin family protein [Pseudomonadota bacterium]
MARLLFVSHCPSPNTAALRDAVVDALEAPEFLNVERRVLAAPEAGADDVRWCDGILLGTTENFGSMAGLTKDFFERVYYPCLDHTVGLPAALYIRAGEDGRGTRSDIGRIMTGLSWKPVQEPLILRGDYRDEFPAAAAELGLTLAAGLDAGIF